MTRAALNGILRFTLPSVALVTAFSALAAVAAPDDDPLPAMARAMDLAVATLGAQADPAYHVAYAVQETRQVTLQGTHGALAGVTRNTGRIADVDLRVGSTKLDNTHKIRDGSWWSEAARPVLGAPLSSGGDPLFELLVRGTDDAYRAARRRLIKVRANDSVKVEREDPSDDFSAAPVATWDAAPGPLQLDEATWNALVREASGVYLGYPAVYDSAVQIVTTEDRRWFVNNEGTRIHDGRNHVRVATWGDTVAADGMRLQVYDYVDVASVDHLPDRAAVMGMVREVAERLTQLRSAPLIDPYAGPAILRGRAAGVFFHEIFGHRVEGHRQKDEDEGQTFKSRVGQPILPDFLSVADDPTIARLGGVDLNGHYAFDDEGVASERVTLVDHGVLRGFLMSRSPIANFGRSNGHGRRQPGAAVVARQGNLMVEAHRTVPYAKLRELLLAEVKKQGKPYGLVFDDISGGFTFTGRSEPNAFSVQPVTVWRAFPDGRPDELVRGVDLIGTPLTTFARIVAAADDRDVFNGVCGAESGWVPVSASSPSLLVGEVEVQRREKQNDLPPLLVAPSPGGPS